MYFGASSIQSTATARGGKGTIIKVLVLKSDVMQPQSRNPWNHQKLKEAKILP